LADASAARVDEDDFAGFARGSQEFFIRGKGQGQGAQAGERHLPARRDYDLVYGQHGSPRSGCADLLAIGRAFLRFAIVRYRQRSQDDDQNRRKADGYLFHRRKS
jgi:hypothetical protein